MPHTPGYPDLPTTVAEASLLARHGGQTLVGGQATRANVLAALPTADWVHFACHAHHDPNAPSGSHLVLHDQPLLVTDIERLPQPPGQLALLSACSTARVGATLEDEAIHLGTAFRVCGFREVVATLWQVGDDHAARVARDFYAAIPANRTLRPGVAAQALHAAVTAARARAPMLPVEWAAHIHLGG
jgi:CHAT domain-containing protein